MALYKYKAIDNTGRIAEIMIEGDGPDDALNRLRGRGLLPVENYGEVSNLKQSLFSRDKFNVYMFTNRLAPLLQAHIRLERALAIMANHETHAANKQVILELRKGLHEGKKFSELIRGHGNRFPRLYANLIETGEQTGCMAEVVAELQRFLNESKEQRDFLVTSAIYPVTILLVTSGVIVLMFTVFIPRFSQIFLDMGKKLPLPTEIMLTASRVINFLWPVWILLLIGVIWCVAQIRRGGKAKLIWDRYILKFPVLGSLLKTIEISRFIRTLSILIGNHVPMLDTIRIGSKVIGNTAIAAGFDNLSGEIRAGNRLSAALQHSAYMPGDAIQMLEVGEESGQVGEMLSKVADEQEKQVKLEIKRLLALFEPVVIIILALIILLVVISIFLAVMEMNQIN